MTAEGKEIAFSLIIVDLRRARYAKYGLNPCSYEISILGLSDHTQLIQSSTRGVFPIIDQLRGADFAGDWFS